MRLVRLFFPALASLAWASYAAPSHASCTECLVLTPDAGPNPPSGRPMLVLLHGDDGYPHTALLPWKKTALARGFVLFAPKSPRFSEWWKWGGDPQWIADRTEELIVSKSVDRSRIYLAGWSGGATYLTRKAGEIPPLFAAIAVLGGGLPPGCKWSGFRCMMPEPPAPCGANRAPVYYLSGSANGMHQGAVQARDFLRACGHAVTWEFLPGVNHPGEFIELSKPERTHAILDWLLAQATPSALAPVDAGTSPWVDAGAPSTSSHEPIADASVESLGVSTTPSVAPVPPAARGCACDLTHAARDARLVPLVLGVAGVLTWRRRPRKT